jgi:Na+/H+-translocating membrane pyrophosphatase
MRLNDIFSTRFLKWFLIGVAAALVCDVAAGQSESLILVAAQSGLLPPTLGIALEGALLVVLTVVALLLIGERAWTAIVASCVATVVGYLIGAAHLAALSIGVSVITLGERIDRGRMPLAAPRRATRAARRARRPKR